MRPNLLVALRWGLLLFLLCFILYLAWMVAGVDRSSPTAPDPESIASTPEPVGRQAAKIESMDFTRTQGGEESLRVQAEDMTVFSDGVKQLLRAVIGLPSQEGRADWSARSARATLRDNPQGVRMEGRVVVSSGDGAELRTEVLFYDETSRVAKTEGPVHLTKDRNWCKADRLIYSLETRIADLDGNVHGGLFDAESGETGTFSADHLTWNDRSRAAQLDGSVHAVLTEWTMDADRLDIRTSANREVDSARAKGAVRLVARDDSTRHLAGDTVDFVFEDGVLRRLEARGNARAQIPGDEGRPIVVQGEEIRLGIGPGRNVEALEATAGAESKVRVSGLPGVDQAKAEAKLLNALLTDTGEVRSAILHEEVVIYRDDLQGFGELATWRQEEATLELTGSPGILSPRGKAYGNRVVVQQGGATSLFGEVHSVMEPSSEGSEDVPLFDGDGGPIFITAETLEISSDGKRLHYEGDPVQAKQGDSSVLCETLTLNEVGQKVDAVGSVRSRIRLQEQAKQGQPGALKLGGMVDGRGDRMTYVPGKITYEGSGILKQGEDWLAGDTIDLHLSEGPKEEVERIVARGAAEAHFGVQHGWADRLDYDVGKERVLLFGETSPARAEDRSRNSSGSGKVLTIQLDTGTVDVESDPLGRTETTFRSGSAPAPVEGSAEEGDGQPGS